ncbi:MAG: SdiA-regulated domain-containing protein [Deltaproteobacteria bacterium]|nr:SdiA-regulated domain-containing protein [Deltaproteobacteria bacterium]
MGPLGASVPQARAYNPDMTARRCFAVALLLLVFAASAGAEPWPGDEAVEFGSGLPAEFEPSGAVWHPQRETLFVVGDGGELAELTSGGKLLNLWEIGGDLEAVAHAGGRLYLAREHPDAILEFDPERGTMTGAEWDLTPFLRGKKNRGLEALTFAEGAFYAGLQADGRIHVFELGEAGVVRPLRVLDGPHDEDLSGLHYEPATGVLYAIYDGADLLVELDLDAEPLREYPLPGAAQEAVALIASCPWNRGVLVVGEDESGELWRYSFPLSCENRWLLWAALGAACACLAIGVNWFVRRPAG